MREAAEDMLARLARLAEFLHELPLFIGTVEVFKAAVALDG